MPGLIYSLHVHSSWKLILTNMPMDVKRPKAFKFYKTKRKWNNAHKKYLIECTVNSVSIGCMWKKKNSAEAKKNWTKKWEAIYVKWIIKTEIISLKSEIRVLWILENNLASKFAWVSLGVRTFLGFTSCDNHKNCTV